VSLASDVQKVCFHEGSYTKHKVPNHCGRSAVLFVPISSPESSEINIGLTQQLASEFM
jgi:hypothetical protein